MLLFRPDIATMSDEKALHVIDQIKPLVVISMHYHLGRGGVNIRSRIQYPVRNLNLETLVVSKRDLPETPEA